MGSARLAQELKERVSKLSSQGARIEPLDECPHSVIVVRTTCYVAFFSVVQSSESLLDMFRAAQSEINAIRAKKGSVWPRDLQLVLLVADESIPDPKLVQEILNDRLICRKFLLFPNGRPLEEVLEDLPFWTSERLFCSAPAFIGEGVVEQLTDFNPQLVRDIAGYFPGAEEVARKIRDGKYDLDKESSTEILVDAATATPSGPTRVEALDIEGFRGINLLESSQMPLSSDVIFIYGPNGVGKTSIADAIEWAISGEIRRLHRQGVNGDVDPLINVSAIDRRALVTCHFANREPIKRIRQDGETSAFIGETSVLSDHVTIDHAVGTQAPSKDTRLRIERLRALFRASHLLSQHDMQWFLAESAPEDRFDTLTNMIGADEFVRFRNKVGSVVRHLRRFHGSLVERNKSLGNELSDLSKRLRDRQEELAELSQGITSGKTSNELAVALLSELRDCDCPVERDWIDPGSTGSARIEAEQIAVKAEVTIREKKKDLSSLSAELKAIEKDVPGYRQAQGKCRELSAEIEAASRQLRETRSDQKAYEDKRQQILDTLKELRTRRSDLANRHADLSWARGSVLERIQMQSTQTNIETSLASKRQELHDNRITLDNVAESLNKENSRKLRVEQIVADRIKQANAIESLLKKLPQVESDKKTEEQLRNDEQQQLSRLETLRQTLKDVLGELNSCKARFEELQRSYDSRASRFDVLKSFLAQISEMVRSAECPLCGRDFASADEARKAIEGHLSEIPSQLRDLAHTSEQARSEVESKQEKVDQLTAMRRDIEGKLTEIRDHQAEVVKSIESSISDCSSVSIVLSEESISDWKGQLEAALKECAVSGLKAEADTLTKSTSDLTDRLSELRSKAAGLEREISDDEKRLAECLTELQNIDYGLVQRGFELDALPASDYLDTEISNVQSQLERCGEEQTENEESLQKIDTSIKDAGSRLKTLEDQVASNTDQLRHHESICNRFETRCHSSEIDPERVEESVSEGLRKALGLIEKLSELERPLELLQRAIAVDRLRQEVTAYERSMDDLESRVEKGAREESQLRGRQTYMERLQSETVKLQFGVVKAHIESLEPITQQIYRRLSAHPIFGEVHIRIDEESRQLDLEARMSEGYKHLNDLTVSPSAFFSDAQMNVLALTVFLAGALRQQWSGLKTIVIDDPIQQMDEMRVTAFLDLIRGLSGPRQFIVFTCSRTFYLLAIDKLSCLNRSNQSSFMAYRLEGTPTGHLEVYPDVR